ncbi:MAG: MDR/zinc-dependent alcohol dehydrogenase-like family protein [Candidatus Binataceae bacterium]
MKALYLDKRLMLRDDYPDPRPAQGESLVRVNLAGICGTDLELVRGYMAYRGVPGHEFVGHAVESGRPELIGKRVVGEINAACGKCDWCHNDLGRHCPNRTVLGILGRDGAFTEYLVLPDDNLLPVPDSVPDNAAIFCEPLAAAREILAQISIDPGESVAILGDGRLGAIIALALKSAGVSAIIGGHHADKLERLAALQLSVSPEQSLEPGFDVVIDATGRPEGFKRALELVRPRGRVILKSTAAGSTPVNLAPLVVNEITVIGSRCGRFGPALQSLASRTVDPSPLISAVYPLEDAAEAFKAAGQSSNFKVLLRIS